MVDRNSEETTAPKFKKSRKTPFYFSIQNQAELSSISKMDLFNRRLQGSDSNPDPSIELTLEVQTSESAPPDVLETNVRRARRNRFPGFGAQNTLSTTTTAQNISKGHATHSNILTINEVDEKPWKYIGYKGYSSFLAAENDFFILRRFSTISVRIALVLQDRVTVLEDQLEDLDKRYMDKKAEDQHQGSFRDDEPERKKCLEDLTESLTKYNDFVLKLRDIHNQPAPLKADVDSISKWHKNHDNSAIVEEERSYLDEKHQRDLFSVVPKQKAPLRILLERSERIRSMRLWREKNAPEIPYYEQDTIKIASDKRVDRFTTLLVIVVGLAMLIAPLWVLEYLVDPLRKLGTITAFLVTFLVMINYVSTAKPFEILAATAGYAAVLMVFMQLSSNSNSNSGSTSGP